MIDIAVWSLAVTVLAVGGGILLKVGAAQQKLDELSTIPDRVTTLETEIKDLQQIRQDTEWIKRYLMDKDPKRGR